MANVLLGIHCVVPGCGSTQRRVNQWKATLCQKPKHKGKPHAQCMCPEPYQFFKFPTELKLQKLWLDRVGRPDLEVNNLTRVCSLHFIEGKPTRRNYFPNVNLNQDQEDEADNEMEEMEYFDEGEEEVELHIHEASNPSPPPAKRGRGAPGTVSIVPMDRLQDNEEQQRQDEEDEYEEGVTISRFNQGRDGGAYEVPTNAVTITRVTTAQPTATTTTCSKPANRFINTSKPRGDGGGVTTNRFLKDRTPRTSPATTSASSVNLVRGRGQPSKASSAAPQSKQAVGMKGSAGTPVNNSSTGLRVAPSRLAKNNSIANANAKVQQKPIVKQEKSTTRRSYELDMDDDDEDGDSSELSDIGIDIQPTGALKQYTSKDISTAKTLSSLVATRNPPAAVVAPKDAPVAKPKLIPILAVAPKSQQGPLVQQQQQPVHTLTRMCGLIPTSQLRKVTPTNATNLFVATSAPKPLTAAPTATASSSGQVVTNTVIAVTGTPMSAIKAEHSDQHSSPVITSTASLAGTVVAAQQPAPPPPPQPTGAAASTLATYDPSKQQLQIANPVKYIQECHTRIAQLLAEKQTLESRNTELEAKVQELQKNNNDLRREIVHQALNAAKRGPQPTLSAPTFNLVPTALMNTPTFSTAESTNGNNSDSNSGGGNKPQPRIRYVIRRTQNLPNATK